jgi:hypothetical protein
VGEGEQTYEGKKQVGSLSPFLLFELAVKLRHRVCEGAQKKQGRWYPAPLSEQRPMLLEVRASAA